MDLESNRRPGLTPVPAARRGREFRRSGSRRPATPATRGRFFVAGPFARLAIAADGSQKVEGGPFHAKEMGTLLAACGRSTASWPKVWEVPFSHSLTHVCRECAAIAAGSAERMREGRTSD